MDDTTRNQDEENVLDQAIDDDALEKAACTGNGRAGILTQWMCTALYFCPGP
jgi:hypothetical protein